MALDQILRTWAFLCLNLAFLRVSKRLIQTPHGGGAFLQCCGKNDFVQKISTFVGHFCPHGLDPDSKSGSTVPIKSGSTDPIESGSNWDPDQQPCLAPVLRIRIHQIHMFLGLLDPDPLVRGMDPDSDPDLSIKKIVRKTCFVTSFLPFSFQK